MGSIFKAIKHTHQFPVAQSGGSGAVIDGTDECLLPNVKKVTSKSG